MTTTPTESADRVLLAEVLAAHDQRTRVETAAMGVGLATNPLMERVRAALAAQQAAAPGALDADELTRLRRLLTALGHADAFELSDEYVRGELCHVLGLAAGKLERAALAAVLSAPGAPEAPKQPAHGHRDDYYLLANGRRLGLEPISRVRNMPNWVLAMELFATGSTSARQLCRDAGVHPDSTITHRAAQLDGGQEGSGSNG